MHELDFLNNISESSILILGDEELLSLWEDAHTRRGNIAKGYSFDHYTKNEKVKLDMMKSQNEITKGNSKKAIRRGKAKFKKQINNLGVFDNEHDANKEQNKAASLRQNLNDVKQARRINIRNPKQEFDSKGKFAEKNPNSTKPIKPAEKIPKELEGKTPEERKRINSKFSPDLHGRANVNKKSYFLTPNGNEGTRVHEINHLKDDEDLTKMFGKKTARKYNDQTALANYNLSTTGSKYHNAIKDSMDKAKEEHEKTGLPYNQIYKGKDFVKAKENIDNLKKEHDKAKAAYVYSPGEMMSYSVQGKFEKDKKEGKTTNFDSINAKRHQLFGRFAKFNK